ERGPGERAPDLLAGEAGRAGSTRSRLLMLRRRRHGSCLLSRHTGLPPQPPRACLLSPLGPASSAPRACLLTPPRACLRSRHADLPAQPSLISLPPNGDRGKSRKSRPGRAKVDCRAPLAPGPAAEAAPAGGGLRCGDLPDGGLLGDR